MSHLLQHHRRSVVLVAILMTLGIGAGACTSTGAVTRPTILAALKKASTQGPASERIVVKDGQGGSVRLGPRSRIRFGIKDAMVTEWIVARDLRTSALGVSVGTELIASWDEISFAEVENLSGTRVLIGVVVVAAVVAVVTAIVIKMMKSKKDKSSSSSRSGGGIFSGIFSGGSSRSRHRVYRPALPVRRRRARRRSRRIGPLHAHRFRRSPAGVALRLAVALDARRRPSARGPAELPVIPRRRGSSAPAAGPGFAEDPAPPELRLSETRPLFTAGARRRSSYRFLGAATFGNAFLEGEAITSAAILGVRLAEIFELAGGLRHMRVDHLSDGGGHERRASYIGFGRVGLNIDLDAGRYVSVPISVDLGTGDQVDRQWRINWGLRVRPLDWLWVGIYPFSPTYTVYRGDKDLRDRGAGWSFPSSVELGFSF